VNWDALGALILAGLTFVGMNVGALKWMFERYHDAIVHETTRWDEVERGLFELRAALPLEYVRREDWIRFSGTLDAKLDAMRDEVRQETAALKEKLYEQRD
jgi:hypothetical protein